MAKKIIVAPLNWGLGHASRCVPIIHFLLKNSYTPIIASDGVALTFLRKEFPNLGFLELPSYKISYARNLKLGLFFQLPKIVKAVKKEQQFIAQFIAKNKDIVGIISDNRFGVRSTKVPSVYITHQTTVLAGMFTTFTSFVHQQIINKFNECWIPDTEKRKLSGKLSVVRNKRVKVKFIGALSRFKKESLPIKNDILIVLSGIESQRASLEKKMLAEFQNSNKRIVLVQGKIESKQTKSVKNKLTIYNYLLSEDIEREINQSEIVLCRSGYSSIMDVAVLEKKAFFIPTEKQTEQEYLARFLDINKQAPFSSEKAFNSNDLRKIENYKGLQIENPPLSKELLRLF